MKEADFYKKLRTLGGENMTTQGFSVPKDIREGMGLEEGDTLKIHIEKHGDEEVEGIRDEQEVRTILHVALTGRFDDFKRWFEQHGKPSPIPDMDNMEFSEEGVIRGYFSGLTSYGLKNRPELAKIESELEEKLGEHLKKRGNWFEEAVRGRVINSIEDKRAADLERHDRKKDWERRSDMLYGRLTAVKWLLGEDQPEVEEVEADSKIQKISEEENE